MRETAVPPNLRWTKIRLDAQSRSILDRAVADVNRKRGAQYHLVRHPSGKVLTCRVDDFWFCHVGVAGPEPEIWTLAVDTRPEPRTFLPALDAADFAECCDLLGFRSEAEQIRFQDFLTPDPHRPSPSPDPGAL